MVGWKRVCSAQIGVWLLLPLLMLLAACAFSPERAVVQEVLKNGRGWKDLDIDANTIRVLQTQPRDDGMVIQVVFQAVRDDGQRLECLYEYQTRKSRLEWVIGGGGGGCGPGGGSGESIGIGSGWNWSERESWSRVSGLVYVEGIVAVKVVWDDGESQRVEVVNGSYLAVRDGVHKYLQVQALDAGNEVVYVYENPETGSSNSNEVP